MIKFLFRLVLLIVAFVIVAAAALWFVASRGFSARAEPTALEKSVALRLRSLATPSDAKAARNPVPDDAATRRAGMEHFADHCAVCHGNDGSGNGELGRGLYPKPPDLRETATQSLTDGELFYVIENGIRFTGMPAFGGDHDSTENWHLVRFIRHLPSLTPAELREMKQLNPKAPDERAEAEAPAAAGKRPAAPAHTHVQKK